MALVPKSRVSCQWFSQLARVLDPRSAPRLATLFFGVVVARGLRTVTSWIRAARLGDEFRPCYTTVAAAGKRAASVAASLVRHVVNPLLPGDTRVTLAIDDTPTERVGPCVEGRGIHHNPTPGPADSAFLSGHVWVTIAALVSHGHWGVIALPLLAKLYVRKDDLPGIAKAHRPNFQTKLELAVALVKGALAWLNLRGKPLWIVVDGAYAMRPFLKPVLALGVTVVSRLRKDAALFSLPEPRGKKPGRGRPRKKGEHRISLAKRAGAKNGWQTVTVSLYGKPAEKTVKTFLAYWGPVGAIIRVVLVTEANNRWRAYFGTDTNATIADILETVADRFAIETAFRDVKEIVGAGQQQTRFHFANIGGFHLCLWTFTMTEAWAWNQPENALTHHRHASPWDDQPRRPSHADKRNAFRRELLRNEIHVVLHAKPTPAKLRQLTDRLVNLAA